MNLTCTKYMNPLIFLRLFNSQSCNLTSSTCSVQIPMTSEEYARATSMCLSVLHGSKYPIIHHFQ